MAPDNQAISAWVASHESDILELAMRFVSVPSENRPPHGDEAAFQNLFAETLGELGMSVTTFEVPDAPGILQHDLFWPGRDYTNRPNVLGTMKGRGSGRSLLLTGHGDVVIGLPGRHDPFTPHIDGDRLYGRGSNDMKGGLATAVMAVACLRDLGTQLGGDLLVESVVDEEMAGANGTLASRLFGHNPDAAVIIEPSNMVICPGHLGGRIFRITIRGGGGMGFSGEKIINPIYGLARLLAGIEQFGDEWAARPAPSAAHDPGRGLAVIPSIARAGDFELGQGDGAPTSASLEIWIETFPGMTADELDSEFLGRCRRIVGEDALLSRMDVSYEHVSRYLHGSGIDPDEAIVREAAAAMAAVRGRENSIVRGAPFACDGFILHDFGIPAIIMGPTGDNAHGRDEFVSCRSLYDLTATLAILIDRWCAIR